jgi:hypothetical protein
MARRRTEPDRLARAVEGYMWLRFVVVAVPAVVLVGVALAGDALGAW